jgi:hypothetical protein
MPDPHSALATTWSRRIQEWKSSQSSIAQWCRDHNLSYHQFLYWKSRFYGQDGRASFIELQDLIRKDSGVSIEVNGVHIHARCNFDENTLIRLVKLLGKL